MSVRVDSYLQMLIYNNLGVQTSIKSLILFPRNDVIANMKRYHNYGPLLWLVLIGPAVEEGRLLGRFRSGENCNSLTALESCWPKDWPKAPPAISSGEERKVVSLFSPRHCGQWCVFFIPSDAAARRVSAAYGLKGCNKITFISNTTHNKNSRGKKLDGFMLKCAHFWVSLGCGFPWFPRKFARTIF